jgi:cysteine desulfurase
VKKYSPKAHVHIDAVQAFGKIECTVTNDIDSISIAAHKFGGPKGIAGLYLKKNHRVLPMLLGGRQQGGFRPGTENFPLTNAFFKATKITLLNQAKNFENIDQFNKLIKEAIKEFIPTSQFPFEETSPYILTFIVPGISSDIILRHLEVKNIFVGTTSACSAKIKAYNPTLAALKIPEKCHKNILRISFGSTSNQADIELFLKEFKAVWSELRHFLK